MKRRESFFEWVTCMRKCLEFLWKNNLMTTNKAFFLLHVEPGNLPRLSGSSMHSENLSAPSADVHDQSWI